MRRNGFAEAGEAAAGVDGNSATNGGDARSQQTLGFAFGTQTDVFVPVEFERSREVVDLGEVDVFGADAGLLVGSERNGVFPFACWCWHHGGGVTGDVGKLEHALRICRRHGADGLDAAQAIGVAEVLASEVHAAHHHGCGAIAGGADVEQAQRVADDGAIQNVGDHVLFAEAGVGVVQTVTAVLHLHLSEVFGGGAVHVHATASEQCEVHRVRCAEHVEALPVRVVLAVAATHRSKEALGCGVGANDQSHITEASENLSASRIERHCARGACGVTAADASAVPAELLRERGTRYETGIAIANGVGASDVLDVFPLNLCIGERSARSDHSVFGEVVAPLAPWVHAHAKNCDVAVVAHCAASEPGVAGAHT